MHWMKAHRAKAREQGKLPTGPLNFARQIVTPLRSAVRVYPVWTPDAPLSKRRWGSVPPLPVQCTGVNALPPLSRDAGLWAVPCRRAAAVATGVSYRSTCASPPDRSARLQ